MSGPRKVLRGYRLREEIAALVPVGQIVHYLELVDRLHETGSILAGSDRAGQGANVLVALQRSPGFESVSPRSGEWRRVPDGKTPQEWADFLASAIFKLTSEGESGGWVSGLPPDAAARLKAAVDTYCTAYDEFASPKPKKDQGGGGR